MSLTNWKKLASAQQADAETIERAFADQAYQAISGKASAILQDPYFLGFEKIWSNDTNTKLVGMFGIRIGEGLFFIPSFFMNGSIRNSDMLWQNSVRQFTPLDNEWVAHFISQAKGNRMGEPLDRNRTHSLPPVHYLERIRNPPNLAYKDANYKDAEAQKLFDDHGIAAAWSMMQELAWQRSAHNIKSANFNAYNRENGADWEKLFDEIMAPVKKATFRYPNGWLRDQLKQSEMLVTKFAHVLDSNPHVFEACLQNGIDVAGILDDLDEITARSAKKAAADSPFDFSTGIAPGLKEDAGQSLTAGITIADNIRDITGFESAGFVQKIAEASQKGRFAEDAIFPVTSDDRRDPEQLVKILPMKADVVTGEMNLQTVCQPGIYELITADMQETQAALFSYAHQRVRSINSNDPAYPVSDCCSSSSLSSPHYDCCIPLTQDLFLYWLDEKKPHFLNAGSPQPFGKMVGTIGEKKILKDKFEVGDTGYFVQKKTMSVIDREPYRIAMKTEKDGIITLGLHEDYGHGHKIVVINPAAVESQPELGLLNGDVAFLPVATTPRETSEMASSNYGSSDLPASKVKPFDVQHGPAPANNEMMMQQLITNGLAAKIDITSRADLNSAAVKVAWHEGGKAREFTYNTHGDKELLQTLTCKLAMAGPLAEVIGEHAKRTGGYECVVTFPEGREVVSVKSGVAFGLQATQQPVWRFTQDSNFPQAQFWAPQDFISPVVHTVPPMRNLRLRDAWSMGGPAPVNEDTVDEDQFSEEEMLTMSPQDLEQVSKMRGMPSVFEKGMFASLIHNEDAVAFIDQSLPPLKSAVDRLGRTLFMLIFKPRDFEEAYGEDDMKQMEMDVSAQFKSLGRCVLNLIKRSPKAREARFDWSKDTDV